MHNNTLLSVGLDVGTTTTQMVVSQLEISNQASAFSVPDWHIVRRDILYRSPIFFTPLLGDSLVDGEKIRDLMQEQFRQAGIRREQVDTGAVIITGETSRKENAATVARALSEFSGDFVVATAGPALESCLAARGAGAVELSEATGRTVLHMDIGGGTCNMAWLEHGKILATGCLNIGGRLLKFDKFRQISYRSPVLNGLFDYKIGQEPPLSALQALADTLTSALEMAAGLCPDTELLEKLWTAEDGKSRIPPQKPEILSFSGGVADCIDTAHPPFAFGDLGPLLGQAIQKSRLCAGSYRLGTETIRATVIGAGSHSAQLSGSTVFYQNVSFPLKNLPVVSVDAAMQESPHLSNHISGLLQQQDGAAVLALPGYFRPRYAQISDLAQKILVGFGDAPVLLALESDMAKALGQAIALTAGAQRTVLCMDGIHPAADSYLDVGAPIGSALPLIIKTLIFGGESQQ